MDVVIATNRPSPYLAAAIDSVNAQTWPHWRLIVVDDGSPSPDHARSVVAGTPGALVIQQESRGLPAARNTGIRRGEGDLIAFLDDDDVWDPRKLELQVSAWRRAPHHVGVCSGGWYVDSEGQPFGDGWTAEQSASFRYVSGEVPLPRIVSLMITRSAWEELGGFDETFSVAEDLEFILRLVQLGEIVAVSEPLVGYRRHGSNMSAGPGSADSWRASDRLLRMQIEGAVRRGDATSELLLRTNLSQANRIAAEALVGDMIGNVRRRDARAFREQLTLGTSLAPGAVAGALTARVASMARRGLQRALRRTRENSVHA